jgi:hypothetical protein
MFLMRNHTEEGEGYEQKNEFDVRFAQGVRGHGDACRV